MNNKPIENIQQFLRKYQNRQALKALQGKTSKEAIELREILQHKDFDSATISLLRLFLFFIFIYLPMILKDDPVYGIPILDFHEDVEFIPQIRLFFRETQQSLYRTNHKQPTRLEISFRLYDAEEMIKRKPEDNTKLKNFAKKIWSEFKNYKHSKGIVRCNYRDTKRGYRMSILSSSVEEGKQLIEKVLDLQDHRFNRMYFSNSQHDRWTNQGQLALTDGDRTRIIYGEQVPNPIKRSVGEVQLYTAELKVHGVNDLCLYSLDYRRSAMFYGVD